MDSDIIKNHFNSIADEYDHWKDKSSYYYDFLKKTFSIYVPQNKKVLDLGCGTGDILAHLNPRDGLGIDMSSEMVKKARKKYKNIKFLTQDAQNLRVKDKFDYIIMADLIDHLPDISMALRSVKRVSKKNTKVVITTINPFWEPILDIAEKFKLKMPEGQHNWVPLEDLKNIVEINGFEVEESDYSLLIPKNIPVISDWVNDNLNKLGFIKKFGFVQYIVCKKKPTKKSKKLNCTVVIPALNEEGNIVECVKRVPRMGKGATNIIVVDDGSTDQTSKKVEALAKRRRNVTLLRHNKNRGKVWAVKTGFDHAKDGVIMILDADMTVPPEELVHFHELIENGTADFVNGTRMVYPMEDQAMRRLNLLGNKLFGYVFSWIIGRRITDTLCGTKALLKKDYKKIKMGGEPWGDFDLLFGAGHLKLNIVEFPVHYKRRVAGESKMKTFRHGVLLLKMCFRGAYLLKLSK